MENLLNIKKFIIYILLYSFVFGCNQSNELYDISLTKDYQSSEPNLYTSIKGDTYLSFISSSENSDLSKLYFSKLELDKLKWSKPTLINSSNDWFVNWADFPRITTNNQNGISVHYLEKVG